MEELSCEHMSLLAGRLSEDDIPAVKAHVIRVYMCAVGTDSMTEREYFVENVYPKLREYCKEKYGLEFQVSDLTWGLSSSQIEGQGDITPLRIREIQRCHALSAGPNFITFLGQRYGPRSLPDVILADEYDAIQIALRTHKSRDTRNFPLLDQCYIIDNNNIPPVYVLRSKAEIVPEFKDSDETASPNALPKWAEVQDELRTLLQRGAELSYQEGSMDSMSKDRYFVSELENQITLGIAANDNPKKRCVLITRQITDLKNYLQDPRTPRFAELKYNEREDQYELDTDSVAMLERLAQRTEKLVSPHNTLHFDVLWKFDNVISPHSHSQYLRDLGDKLFRTCTRLIDENAPPPENDPHSLVEEARQHWTRCRYMAFSQTSRDITIGEDGSQESPLSALRDYVTGTSETPLVVYGAPGCGKSSIVSMLAVEMETFVEDYIFILRYIGHTPNSKDLKQLLSSICNQIILTTDNAKTDIPTDFSDLVKFFHDLIKNFPAYSRLIILLDDLELLSSEHEAHALSWVPTELPQNVKIILSVHQTSHNLLDRFKEKIIPHKPKSFLEIPAPTVGENLELLNRLLYSMDRTLTDQQLLLFHGALEKEPLPLFVELLANIAKDLKSFDGLGQIFLPSNCEEGIQSLFDKLESRHGKVFVSKAFAYMVASYTGVSDCEMEDLLSLDEDVLNEVYDADYHPGVRRIPFVKWLALKQDVESFLTYKDTDGVTVAVWQHDSFAHVVKERYLDSKIATAIHSTISDYFLGTWAGKPKPVRSRARKFVATFNSDRKVPRQPLIYGGNKSNPTDQISIRFNKRMYDQVPRHLDLAGRYQELNTLVFFNYQWLYNKIKALSLQHIMSDLLLNPGEEVSLVEEALRVSEQTIQRDINSLPTEITGHLLPYYNTHVNIRDLIRQCDTDGLRQCALLANFPYLQVPGSSLQFTLVAPEVMEHFLFLHACVIDDSVDEKGDNPQKFIACKKRDDVNVNIFDLLTGDLRRTVFTSNGELYATPDGKHFIIVDHVTEKSIKIHDTSTGAFVKQIIIMNHIDGKSSKYKKGPLALTNDRLCSVVTLTNSVLCIAEIPSGKILHLVALDGKSNICAISPNGKMVFCNCKGSLLAYDLYTLEQLFLLPVGNTPTHLVFTRDGKRCFLSNDLDSRVTIMHLNDSSVDMTYRAVLEDKMPGDYIRDLKISPDDESLLIRGDTHILVYHRRSEKIIATFTKPASVPAEFRLPRKHYVQMTFSHADFTSDSAFVVGTLLRNIHVWKISTGQLMTTIQAPIGLISSLLVCRDKNKVLTHIQGSKNIEVWNVDAAVPKVNVPDRLTGAIGDFQETRDGRIAFAWCQNSDEVGVLCMSTGNMVDLLTHDMPVRDFAATPRGDWALVSTEPRLRGTAFKLWNLAERRVVMEVGDVAGYCVKMTRAQGIVMLAQKDATYKSPYYISMLNFVDGNQFYEHAYTQTVITIRSKPFVTDDDEFLVVNSVLEPFDSSSSVASDDASSRYTTADSRPCIIVFDMTKGMKPIVCDAESMKFEHHLHDIVEVRPCHQISRTMVAAIFSCKEPHYPGVKLPPLDPDIVGNGYTNNNSHTTGYPYGFFLLDAATGNLAQLCIPFPRPSTGLGANPLVFSSDCTLCLDEQSNVYHVPTEEFIGQLQSHLNPPRAFALCNAVVLYYKSSMLMVLRVSDGVPIAQVDVHETISRLHVCSDDRTVLVGCENGSVFSYTVIDPSWEDPALVISTLPSRGKSDTSQENGSMRSWDKIAEPYIPEYQRPPSAVQMFNSDKILLKQIKAVPRPKSDPRAASDGMTGGARSQACRLM